MAFTANKKKGLFGLIFFLVWGLIIPFLGLASSGAPQGSWVRNYWWVWFIAFYTVPVIVYMISERARKARGV